MADNPALINDDLERDGGDSPHHGYRGQAERPHGKYPLGLTIAISREAGARGNTIAKRAGAKLGWQVYSQELLEYMAQEGTFRQQVLDQLPAGAGDWVEGQLERLLKEQNISANPSVIELARMILSLGVQGEAILLGRGAGSILPQASTLHVRLVAPVQDRIAYMSQWLRLTMDEAAEQVRKRDQRRAEFLATHFHRTASDLYQYDMALNTSLLGEERSAEIICEAAKLKMACREDVAA
jgi:cytidylate kinase